MKIILGLLVVKAAFADLSVSYQLSFPNAVHHEAEIKATFHGVAQPILEVKMSRSSPGRYALHEFAKNVYRFVATNAQGEALRTTRPDPSTWAVAANGDTVVVKYTVFGDRADGTYDGIDETHAHLNMPATLIWARGFEQAPARLTFEIPLGSNWRIATQLKPGANGEWSAPNLEWLMDSPVEMSAFDFAEWNWGGQAFRMVVHQDMRSAESVENLAHKTQAVVREAAAVFGGLPRFDNGSYTFLLDYLPYAFSDGMEHRDSTSISGKISLNEDSPWALNTVAHEFFHAWNVRRIRPRSLEPFDFERANMCGELWFAEGFTSYYGALLLKRAGFMTLDDFAREMSDNVNQVLNDPGRTLFSVEEMSDQAPFVDAARSVDPTNFSNTLISYYTYGAALAFGLDLEIRQRFPGRSLDDWMKVMWKEHPDIDKPYTLADLESALAEATGNREFAATVFEHHIVGREPLAYAEALKSAGLILRKVHPNQPWLGHARVEMGETGAKLMDDSLLGSPLYEAGLEKGDEITACDGRTIKKSEDFRACLAKHSVGERLRLEFVSRAGNKTASVRVVENPSLEIVTFETAGLPLTSSIKELRSQWLGSKTSAGENTDLVVH